MQIFFSNLSIYCLKDTQCNKDKKKLNILSFHFDFNSSSKQTNARERANKISSYKKLENYQKNLLQKMNLWETYKYAFIYILKRAGMEDQIK